MNRPEAAATAAQPGGAPRMHLHTQRLLNTPILRTLGRLAGPPALLALFQTAISIGDTYFIGRLGTVITSYSIHYTKLYDARAPVRQGIDRRDAHPGE